MDSHVIKSTIEETAYTRIMGHMDVISIVSDYFNIYFPIALLALTLATYFSLGARLLTMLGFQQFLGMYICMSYIQRTLIRGNFSKPCLRPYFILAQDGEVTLELVDEGKEHIKREKRRRQRLAESVSRRRDFANRYGDLESNSRGKPFPIPTTNKSLRLRQLHFLSNFS